jgi:hypothetical protein
MINKIKIIYGGSNQTESLEYTIDEKKGTYKGEFKSNSEKNKIPHGKGKWESNSDKDYLDGDWNGGNFESGKVKITNKSGEIYEGEYKDNKMHGKGKYTWKNGDYEEGIFKDDNFQSGEVKYTYENGNIYEGKYENRKLNGYGKYTWKNGDYEEGIFKDDEFEYGNVKKTLDDGIYEGEWENNKRHGRGKYTFKNGNYEEGEYENDKFTTGEIKYKYKSGDIYEGGWENNFPSGEGKLTIKNIGIIDAEWIDGIIKVGTLVLDNLPLKIEFKNFDEEEKTAIININKIEFILKLNKEEKVQKIINYEKQNENLKQYFNIFFKKDDYDSINYVNAMNSILEYYKKSKIPNIYKFLGLPISFESKMNLLLSKDFNLYITNLLNAE